MVFHFNLGMIGLLGYVCMHGGCDNNYSMAKQTILDCEFVMITNISKLDCDNNYYG